MLKINYMFSYLNKRWNHNQSTGLYLKLRNITSLHFNKRRENENLII